VVDQFADFLERDRFGSRDGAVDYRALLPACRQPALFVAAPEDGLAPPAAVEEAWACWGGEKALRTAPEGVGHTDLLLGRRAPAWTFPVVRDWLVAHAAPADAAEVGFDCVVCGAHHEELPLCFISPAPVQALSVAPEERARRVDLVTDQCVIDGEHFFILGNLDVPIVGREACVRWSVWSSLSRKRFERASALWTTEGREAEPPAFGWLSSEIPGFPDTLNLKLLVHTNPVGVRPRLEVLEQDHPLFRAQAEGVSWERACELSHAATGTTRPGPAAPPFR